MQNRRVGRLHIELPIVLESPSGSGPASMVNISTGGMLIKTGESLPLGTHVWVTFDLPVQGAKKEHFRLEARVVHTGAWGTGVSFVNIDADEVRLVDVLSRLSSISDA